MTKNTESANLSPNDDHDVLTDDFFTPGHH